MRCTEARPLFPVYLDDAVTGPEMQAFSDHLSACTDCRSEYRKLENTRLLVASLGRKAAPPDLALRIRVALSRERSRTWKYLLQRYTVRLENALNAFMFPATAGILTTILFFCAVAGFFAQGEVRADEMVSGLYLSPRLQPPQNAMSSAADTDLNLDGPVVVRVFVDASGQVENYEIIAGLDNEEVRAQLNRALLFATFSPAVAFGRPVAGVTVISYSHVNVKG